MYRPPENTNRVKSIKSRFENVENQNINAKHDGPRSNILGQKKGESNNKLTQNLSRQLSDPAKKNIKRTPAFRIDVNSEKRPVFERSASYNRSFYFERVQQYNTALKNNDSNKKNVTSTENIQNKLNVVINEQQSRENQSKPAFTKSKSSLDFSLIRSKFEGSSVKDNKKVESITNAHEKEEAIINNNNNITNPKEEKTVNATHDKETTPSQISYLYAKPIKSSKTPTQCHKVQTDFAKPSDTPSEKQCDTEPSAAFTDTLKAALKRPLPNGPAPQKPPRTFEHAPVKASDKNVSFLHPNRRKQEESKSKSPKSEHKHDPRYMLTKLENALRNNKIKTRKVVKTETSTTSGEDSDDSVLYKSKTHNRLPPLPKLPSNSQSSSLKFNCFNGLTTTYEAIKEPNSNFFVSCQPEPVYAEPFTNEAIKNLKNEQAEKSLYYMSTALLCDEESNGLNMDDSGNQQISGDGSSLSSATSESEPPVYDTASPTTNHTIRHLIDSFETQQSPTSPKRETQKDTQSSPDGANRIEELKMSLQRTLERSFDCETKDSTGERSSRETRTPVDTIVDKFQTYVKTMPKYQKPKLNKDDRLFYCCLVVGWDSDKPRIMLKYPSNVKIPDNIEDLCYPEAASGPLDISNNAQCYSLVITNSKGERTFGYCRRVMPEGSTRCIPLAYCLLSKHRAPRFYKKILTELESRHGLPDKSRDELISKFYHNKFPRPGQSVKIDLSGISGNLSPVRKQLIDDDCDLKSFVHVNLNGGYGTINDTKKTSNVGDVLADSSTDVESSRELELTLTLHHDTRYEEADLKPLHTLPSHILFKIFASLLLERKVILISCVISTLSSCVDSLQSILYPFSWPHTFIPILPQSLWDVVESPTPVICGILSVAVINDHKIEHGIVVDLDEGNIISEEGDEDNILSGSMKKAWNEAITLANTIPPDDYVHSVYLGDAYVKVFIVALKHYKSHIVNNSFEREPFIQNAKTKGIRRFLRWFTETTMFTWFIDSVINNPQTFSLFDKKIEMYGSHESSMILTKLREWKKY